MVLLDITDDRGLISSRLLIEMVNDANVSVCLGCDFFQKVETKEHQFLFTELLAFAKVDYC